MGMTMNVKLMADIIRRGARALRECSHQPSQMDALQELERLARCIEEGRPGMYMTDATEARQWLDGLWIPTQPRD